MRTNIKNIQNVGYKEADFIANSDLFLKFLWFTRSVVLTADVTRMRRLFKYKKLKERL